LLGQVGGEKEGTKGGNGAFGTPREVADIKRHQSKANSGSHVPTSEREVERRAPGGGGEGSPYVFNKGYVYTALSSRRYKEKPWGYRSEQGEKPKTGTARSS